MKKLSLLSLFLILFLNSFSQFNRGDVITKNINYTRHYVPNTKDFSGNDSLDNLRTKEIAKQNKINELYQKAMTNFSNANYKESIESYDEIIKLDSNDFDAYYNRALCKDALKNYQGAIEDYTKAIKYSFNYYQFFFYIDYSSDEDYNFNELLNYRERAVKINPYFSKAFFKRGLAKYNLNDIEGAELDWKKVKKLKDKEAKKLIKKYR